MQIRHRLQPLGRLLGYPVILVKEVGEGLQVRPANAPAELVQSAHPEGLRVLNYHRIHPRDVDSILDDGGSEEDVIISLREGRDVLFGGAAGHSPVRLNDA